MTMIKCSLKNTMLACALLLPTISSAENLAEWSFPSNNTPILYPKEVKDLPIGLALINSKTWLFSFLDMRKPNVPGSTCYGGGVSESVDEGSPIMINGKYLRFKYACMGDFGVMQPVTENGKVYLNELASSGNEINVVISDNEKLTFPKSDITAMKSRIEKTKNAM
ncbi:hypothetical protein K1S64_10215 [Klebsiella pneumoniae]|uniref:hypothetical protein n=1 Tax=Klebsiella pneumoniae TaxID=573 RepID=UPI00103743F4|nr:hypothetical protein [Klebsiella pneumoniae]MCA5325968.1 hypothetical protein [Klebsiella pneumoniae]MCA5352070.1 hypothetical protein [Klebsiella pneumoniae]MCA5357433.1 hypothetical protein [Klebsiella pneumoniae]MCA5368565.1 hypothetical protein [Klebsiella pneumoniae]MCA5389862.1 hypothetical protein [Klebsiella pneumoniae]